MVQNKGGFEQKGFIFLAMILLFIAIGIVAGRYLFQAETTDYYELGVAAKGASSYGEAYYYFSKSIEESPTLGDAYVQLAEILTLKGRSDEAVLVLEAGLTYATDKIAIRKALSPLYAESKDYTAMETNLISLLPDLSDNNEKSEFNYALGYAYLKQQKLEEARESFRSVLDNYAGTDWYYRSALELALFSLQNATTRSAMLAIAEDSNSSVTIQAGQVEDKLSKASAAEGRDEGQMWGWYGVLMLEQDRCELSLEYFDNAVEKADKYGVHAGIHGYYAECQYRLGDYERAKTQVDIALKADPLLVTAWSTKAHICAAADDDSCATAAYQKLVTVDSQDITYLSDYYSYLYLKEDYTAALEIGNTLFSVATGEYQQDVAAKLISLLFVLADGNAASLVNVPTYLGVLNSESSTYLDYYGWYLYLSDGSGVDEIERSLEIDPYNASACYHLAVIKHEEGDMALALDYASKAVDYDLTGAISPQASGLLVDLGNRV